MAKDARVCPRCIVDLGAVVVETVTIDRCPACRGEFYDHGEVESAHRMTEAERARWALALTPDRPDGPGGHPIPCPGCLRSMRAFRVTGGGASFLVDVCPRCKGTWLDASEVNALRVAILGRRESPREAAPTATAPPEPRPAARGDGRTEHGDAAVLVTVLEVIGTILDCAIIGA